MNANVNESKCFDLVFAERKKQWDPVRFSGTPPLPIYIMVVPLLHE
jgi:hypothetical protein